MRDSRDQPAVQEEGLRALSSLLGAACRPCPERGGELAAEGLCPCQVAVAKRFLATAGQTGTDPGLLDTAPRGALRLQAWASVERPASCDLDVVDRVLAALAEAHAGCSLPGCLACEARRKLEDLASSRGAVLTD